MSLATIILRNLKVATVIGVYDHERHAEQTLKMDLHLHLLQNVGGHTDQLRDTVDYDDVARLVRQFGKTRRAELLERFTYDLGLELMRRYSLRGLDITAWKAVPGLLPAEVAVRVHMDRSDLERGLGIDVLSEDRYND